MKTGLLLSIREKSTRFPGKVLKPILHQSATGHLIDRMKMVADSDYLIIATSTDPRDNVFDDIGHKKKIEVFHGDPEDKLLRYLQVCNHYGLDGCVIIDGDDILCFPEVMEKNILLLKDNNNDVIFWNNLPLGGASSGLTKTALEKVLEIKVESDTEVWGGYFTQSGAFKVKIMEPDDILFKHPEIRITLDYEEDYLFFQEIFKELYPVNPKFSSSDLMNFLVNIKPELNLMTKSAQIKYEDNIAKSVKVKFK